MMKAGSPQTRLIRLRCGDGDAPRGCKRSKKEAAKRHGHKENLFPTMDVGKELAEILVRYVGAWKVPIHVATVMVTMAETHDP